MGLTFRVSFIKHSEHTRIFYVTYKIILSNLKFRYCIFLGLFISSLKPCYLSVVICDGPDIPEVLLVELDAVLVAHDHVLLKGDRPIAPRVCLVKELTQS